MVVDKYVSDSQSGTCTWVDPYGDTKGIHWKWANGATTTATAKVCKSGASYTWGDLEEAWYDGMATSAASRFLLGKNNTYKMPDGSEIAIDDSGNYQIHDENAKVVYRANRMRDFSPYLNASDMLAEFVKYVGTLGVRRRDVLNLPLHLFVSWLVIEAAERDGDNVPNDIVPVEKDRSIALARRPKCLSCGRFIKRLHYENKFPFCSPEHAARSLQLAS